jgi:hypothetical protein
VSAKKQVYSPPLAVKQPGIVASGFIVVPGTTAGHSCTSITTILPDAGKARANDGIH